MTVAKGHNHVMTPDELKRLRARLGLTQEGLANQLGVSRETVARWEIGSRGITEPIVRLLARLAAEARAERKGKKR